MNLEDVFDRIRPSIVAFGSKFSPSKSTAPPLFPPLLGTGFLVHSDGIVATNRHVVEALRSLPRHPQTNEFAGFCLVFSEIKHEEGGLGLHAHLVDIQSFEVLSEFTSSGQFYGGQLPDVAFAQLRVCELPSVQLASDDWYLRVGMEVATAGFPLGENPLVVHGVIGQGTPLLRKGIISAVNPFPCPQPEGFTIDIMSQGGASGSPIFRTDRPEVLGILYAGFPAMNITFAVPASILSMALSKFLETKFVKLDSAPSINDLPTSDSKTTAFLPDDWDLV